MGTDDKYGILEAIDLHVTNQSAVEVSDRSVRLVKHLLQGSLLTCQDVTYIFPEALSRDIGFLISHIGANLYSDLQSSCIPPRTFLVPWTPS